jgi:hypothetical protein
MTVATLVRIKRNDPVRAAVVDLPIYYDCLDNAFCAVSKVMTAHGYFITGISDWYDFAVDSGSQNLVVSKDGVECDNYVVFSWYTMESGRTELTVYVS